MFKISIITGEAWLENVGLCLISPFYPSVRHLGAAYKGRRSLPIQYQTAAGAGVGGSLPTTGAEETENSSDLDIHSC